MSLAILAGKRALVTGASSGIGLALATRLGAAGAHLCLVARSCPALEAAQRDLSAKDISVQTIVADLNTDNDLSRIRQFVEAQALPLDVLVHAAGLIRIAPLASVSMDEFDVHYRTNVRAPLRLTQLLLPSLYRTTGAQIVFINSSLGSRVKDGAGAYAASKHALKAVAETLRAELEPAGVRVLNVFPGNTATAMQRSVCDAYGIRYRPEAMLRPDDVAAAVVNALTLPESAALTELHILPSRK